MTKIASGPLSSPIAHPDLCISPGQQPWPCRHLQSPLTRHQSFPPRSRTLSQRPMLPSSPPAIEFVSHQSDNQFFSPSLIFFFFRFLLSISSSSFLFPSLIVCCLRISGGIRDPEKIFGSWQKYTDYFFFFFSSLLLLFSVLFSFDTKASPLFCLT